jgi:hypothetical protein
MNEFRIDVRYYVQLPVSNAVLTAAAIAAPAGIGGECELHPGQ